MTTIAEKLVIIAENEQRVYDAGKAAGGGGIAGDYNDGYNTGLEDGKLAERQEFWSNLLEGRTNMSYAFTYWQDVAFYPTQDIGEGSRDFSRAFMNFNNANASATPSLETAVDLVARLNNCGVKLNTSTLNGCAYMFAGANITTVPELNLSGRAALDGLFNNASNIKVIEKLILNQNGTNTFTTNVFNCKSLEEIRFEGVIANNISFQYCSLLSNDSVESIIDHLKDLTGSETKTITFHADVGAKLTEEQKTAIAAKNWTLAY